MEIVKMTHVRLIVSFDVTGIVPGIINACARHWLRCVGRWRAWGSTQGCRVWRGGGAGRYPATCRGETFVTRDAGGRLAQGCCCLSICNCQPAVYRPASEAEPREPRREGEPAMEESASPLMLRRRLRTELRAARLEKGLTQEQVAKAMEWSLSKMNRIEKAKTGISANDLKALLPLYGVTDEEHTEELLALARRGEAAYAVAALQRRRACHPPRTDRLRIRGVRHQPVRADVRARHHADRGIRPSRTADFLR